MYANSKKKNDKESKFIPKEASAHSTRIANTQRNDELSYVTGQRLAQTLGAEQERHHASMKRGWAGIKTFQGDNTQQHS
jgi:hypothetical protein